MTQHRERHRGREAALQLLYQWEIGRLGEADIDEAIELFWTVHPATEPRRGFATVLVRGTIQHLSTIDPRIKAHAENWRLERMAVLDRLIMRMAIYEFLYLDTPQRVVIDEALELAKTFSGDQAVAFINGVLDGVRREIQDNTGAVDGQQSTNNVSRPSNDGRQQCTTESEIS